MTVGKTTIGSSEWYQASDRKIGASYVSNGEVVNTVYARIRNSGYSNGVVKAFIHNAVTGVRLAVSAEVSLPATQTTQSYVQFTLPSSITLPVGSVILGIIIGKAPTNPAWQASEIYFGYDSSSVQCGIDNVDPYATGPSNPFNASGTPSLNYHAYDIYAEGPPTQTENYSISMLGTIYTVKDPSGTTIYTGSSVTTAFATALNAAEGATVDLIGVATYPITATVEITSNRILNGLNNPTMKNALGSNSLLVITGNASIAENIVFDDNNASGYNGAVYIQGTGNSLLGNLLQNCLKYGFTTNVAINFTISDNTVIKAQYGVSGSSSMNWSTNGFVERNHISGILIDGIKMKMWNNVTVRYNEIDIAWATGQTVGGAGINFAHIDAPTVNVKVLNNHIYNSKLGFGDTYGITVEPDQHLDEPNIGVAASGMVIQYNLIENIGHGMWIRGNNCIIQYNKFRGCTVDISNTGAGNIISGNLFDKTGTGRRKLTTSSNINSPLILQEFELTVNEICYTEQGSVIFIGAKAVTGYNILAFKINGIDYTPDANGLYSLTVGAQDYTISAIYAPTPPTPVAPTAIIQRDQQTVVQNVPVNFSGAASLPGSKPITQYAWDFGDGSAVAYGVSVSHTYTAAATYTVTLTVTTSEVAPYNQSTVTDQFTVVAPTAITLTLQNTKTPAPGTYTFTIGSTYSFEAANPPTGTRFGFWTLDAETYSDNPMNLEITPYMNGKTLSPIFISANSIVFKIPFDNNEDYTMGRTGIWTRASKNYFPSAGLIFQPDASIVRRQYSGSRSAKLGLTDTSVDSGRRNENPSRLGRTKHTRNVS